MKNISFICLAAGLAMASCGPTRTVYQQPAPPSPPPVYNDPTPPQQPVEQDVTFQTFYDDLSPYGNWIEYPGYGYVWQPDAGPDFRPYSTNGDWIYTDAGWTWNSHYEWGWAPFHYGRWFYQGGYGWMWVPGSDWAPAWVSWRGNNDYYGWAPLAPDVSEDVALNSYNPPVNYWNFVPCQYMGNPGWNQYYVNEGRNVTIINNTTIINNYSAPQRGRYAYAPGPDPNQVRRYTGTEIRPVAIREANRPVNNLSGNQYNVYRPRVAASAGQRAGNGSRPQPATVRPYRPGNDARPAGNAQTNNPAYNNGNNRPPVQNPTNGGSGNNNGYNNNRPVVANPNNGGNNGYNNNRPAVPNPNNGNNTNNGRPNGNAPVNNNPVNNNSRPAMQPPVNNNPVNNNPVNNNSRPAMQPPVNNPQPQLNNPRPTVTTPAVVNRPAPANDDGNRGGNMPRPNPVNRVSQTAPQPGPAVNNNPRPTGYPVNRPVSNPPASAPARQPAPSPPASVPARQPAATPSRPAPDQTAPKTRDAR